MRLPALPVPPKLEVGEGSLSAEGHAQLAARAAAVLVRAPPGSPPRPARAHPPTGPRPARVTSPGRQLLEKAELLGRPPQEGVREADGLVRAAGGLPPAPEAALVIGEGFTTAGASPAPVAHAPLPPPPRRAPRPPSRRPRACAPVHPQATRRGSCRSARSTASARWRRAGRRRLRRRSGSSGGRSSGTGSEGGGAPLLARCVLRCASVQSAAWSPPRGRVAAQGGSDGGLVVRDCGNTHSECFGSALCARVEAQATRCRKMGRWRACRALLLACYLALAAAQAGKTEPMNQKRLNKEQQEANQATNAANNGNAEALGMAGSAQVGDIMSMAGSCAHTGAAETKER